MSIERQRLGRHRFWCVERRRPTWSPKCATTSPSGC